jgi:hypothetical protein
MQLLPPVDAAWLAAIIDGEGCISTNGKRGICCKVQMLNNPIILKCLQIAGCGAVYSWIRHNGNGKRIWGWQVYPRDGSPIMDQLTPYLIEKKEQAELFIAWPLWGARGPGSRIPDYIKKEREAIQHRLMYLNHSEHQHQPDYGYTPKRYRAMQVTL